MLPSLSMPVSPSRSSYDSLPTTARSAPDTRTRADHIPTLKLQRPTRLAAGAAGTLVRPALQVHSSRTLARLSQPASLACQSAVKKASSSATASESSSSGDLSSRSSRSDQSSLDDDGLLRRTRALPQQTAADKLLGRLEVNLAALKANPSELEAMSMRLKPRQPLTLVLQTRVKDMEGRLLAKDARIAALEAQLASSIEPSVSSAVPSSELQLRREDDICSEPDVVMHSEAVSVEEQVLRSCTSDATVRVPSPPPAQPYVGDTLSHEESRGVRGTEPDEHASSTIRQSALAGAPARTLQHKPHKPKAEAARTVASGTSDGTQSIERLDRRQGVEHSSTVATLGAKLDALLNSPPKHDEESHTAAEGWIPGRPPRGTRPVAEGGPLLDRPTARRTGMPKVADVRSNAIGAKAFGAVAEAAVAAELALPSPVSSPCRTPEAERPFNAASFLLEQFAEERARREAEEALAAERRAAAQARRDLAAAATARLAAQGTKSRQYSGSQRVGRPARAAEGGRQLRLAPKDTDKDDDDVVPIPQHRGRYKAPPRHAVTHVGPPPEGAGEGHGMARGGIHLAAYLDGLDDDVRDLPSLPAPALQSRCPLLHNDDLDNSSDIPAAAIPSTLSSMLGEASGSQACHVNGLSTRADSQGESLEGIAPKCQGPSPPPPPLPPPPLFERVRFTSNVKPIALVVPYHSPCRRSDPVTLPRVT